MAWVQLAGSSLRDRLGTTEIDSLVEESADADGKIDEILSQVALDVVGRINAGRRKRGLPPVTDTGLNVPPGSVRHAYTLARRLLTDSFPSLSDYNGEDRDSAYDKAEDHLRDLAENRADADDSGAEDFEPEDSGSSFRTGGKDLMDFINF